LDEFGDAPASVEKRKQFSGFTGRNAALLDSQAAARTIFGQYPGGRSMEGSPRFSANEMSMRQKGAWRITHAVVYVSLCTALFHAIMLMLHQCGERVTSLKHAILLSLIFILRLSGKNRARLDAKHLSVRLTVDQAVGGVVGVALGPAKKQTFLLGSNKGHRLLSRWPLSQIQAEH